MVIEASRWMATVHHSRSGEHGDATDHGLHDRRRRHQPCVDQHFAATAGTRDSEDRQRCGQHHQEGDHPVAELDDLVDDGNLGVRDRGEAAGETLRPGRAAQPGRGDPDDRAGDGDTALGEDDGRGDAALNPQARHGQQVDQPQEESSDGHGLDGRGRQLQHVVAVRSSARRTARAPRRRAARRGCRRSDRR